MSMSAKETSSVRGSYDYGATSNGRNNTSCPTSDELRDLRTTKDKHHQEVHRTRVDGGIGDADGAVLNLTDSNDDPDATLQTATPRVYKRRWFGLAVVSLLNFMSAWSIVTYAPIADITRQHFNFASLTPINWLYISSAFVYVLVSPMSYMITRLSTKAALVISAMILIFGSWLRFIGTHYTSFPCLLIGQILCGASQPFALNIPSHYSNLWFPASSRVTTTAIMSLANPLGQAIGTLVVPFLATSQSKVASMSLYVAVLYTVTVWTALLVPGRPPTPFEEERRQPESSVEFSTRLLSNREFYFLLIPFSIYVAAFNSFASLTQQFIQPYGYSDIQAGIVGAVTIVVGLLASGLCAPIFDRTGAYKWPINICVFVSAICYFALIFAIRPYSTAALAGIITLAACIGAASLILLPVVLELATDVASPTPPELASSMLWVGGQGLGGIFILIMDKLRTSDDKYTRSLVFLIVLTTVPIPFTLALTSSRKVQDCRLNKGRDVVPAGADVLVYNPLNSQE